MKYLSLVLNWIIYSSKDPEKLSTTLLSVGALAIVGALGSALHVGGLTEAFTSAVALLIAVLKVVATISAFLGAMRKVNRTLGGTNAVINSRQLNS